MDEIQSVADFQISWLICERANEIRNGQKAMSIKEIIFWQRHQETKRWAIHLNFVLRTHQLPMILSLNLLD